MRYESTQQNGTRISRSHLPTCLAIELERAGLSFVREQEQTVYYDGIEVGMRRADFVVENQVVEEVSIFDQEGNRHIKPVTCTSIFLSVQSKKSLSHSSKQGENYGKFKRSKLGSSRMEGNQ
jgi:hypothetical protein